MLTTLTAASALLEILRWLSITPLGWPVVPDISLYNYTLAMENHVRCNAAIEQGHIKRLSRIKVYACGKSNMANCHARNEPFCAQTFASLNSSKT